MLALARSAAPSLLRQVWGGSLCTAPSRQLASAAPQRPAEEEESYELLPPGCSLKDPTYGRSFGAERNSMSDPVVFHDSKPVEEYRPLKKKKPVPAAPLNVEAAQAALKDAKGPKKGPGAAAASKEEDDVYVYLPPGSSMRDPLPSSMSDPLDYRRVYHRDPNPAANKPK